MLIDGTDWLAIAAGIAAIMWINWYFFLAARTTAAVVGDASGTGPQELTITVDGGYSPGMVKVKVGRPIRLTFDRKDSGSCSEEIVFPDFGIRRFLPTGEKTIVEVTPTRAGRYEFTCGMSMLRGVIVAED